MKAIFKLLLVACTANAISLKSESYPYFTVSDSKGSAVKSHGGKTELEPLETGSMKTMPNLNDLTKNVFRDGFKEQPADKDSVEERIKGNSRNFMPDEAAKTAGVLARDREIVHYDNRKAWELGVKW